MTAEPTSEQESARWPSRTVYRAFYEYREIYRDIASTSRVSVLAPAWRAAVFRELCRVIVADSERVIREANGRGRSVHGTTQPSRSRWRLLADIPFSPLNFWIQSVASLLATLAHLSVGPKGEPLNLRRTRRSIPTYPTHPSAIRSLVDETLRPFDGTRDRPALNRALRIVDPTIEAGQLLLGAACRTIEHEVSEKGDRAYASIDGRIRLIGFDRDPLAILAAQAAFTILELRARVRFGQSVILRQADSLATLLQTRATYDVVLNNPPWGEPVLGASAIALGRMGVSKTALRDSAVAFPIAALARLRYGGRYGFTLPSQLLTGRRGVELRSILTHGTTIESVEWLSGAAFQPAGVGAVSLSGTMAAPTKMPSWVSIRTTGHESRRVSQSALGRTFEAGWSAQSGRRHRRVVNTVDLGSVADLHLGVQLYCVGRGQPEQTRGTVDARPFDSTKLRRGFVPAVRGRDVQRFALRRPSVFIRWGPWVARPGRLAPGDDLRVFVREICLRDGSLNVAVGRGDRLALSGVHTVVAKHVDAFALTAWLTSPFIRALVSSTCAAFAKKDFQRITISELRAIPVPSLLTGNAPTTAAQRIAEQLAGTARDCTRRPNSSRLAKLDRLTATIAAGL